jgi:hypothetical protein
MLVTDIAPILSTLARGGVLDGSLAEPVDAVVSAGYAQYAPDRTNERARLTELQSKLRAATNEAARKPLRSEILELSERLASSEGGAVFSSVAGGSPYRGGIPTADGGRRVVLTHRGRALLADLEPRLLRAEGLDAGAFEREMADLRAVLKSRADRAATIAGALSQLVASYGGAARSACVGLAVRREDVRAIAETFKAMITALVPHRGGWRDEQIVAAAEGACLASVRLSDIDPRVWAANLAAERAALLAPCNGNEEHALDATMVLAAVALPEREQRLERARELVREIAAMKLPLSLPSALVCASTGAGDDVLLPARIARDARALGAAGVPLPDAAEAIALGLAAGIDGSLLVERILVYRSELLLYSPAAALTPAALLAWLDAPPPETFDNLRLAAACVQTARLATDPGETASNAVKLLLMSAFLGRGAEGDPEEQLRFKITAHERVVGLGVPAMAATAPVLAPAAVAFVRRLLSATEIWDEHRRQTSGYTHGGSWSGGRGYYG